MLKHWSTYNTTCPDTNSVHPDNQSFFEIVPFWFVQKLLQAVQAVTYLLFFEMCAFRCTFRMIECSVHSLFTRIKSLSSLFEFKYCRGVALLDLQIAYWTFFSHTVFVSVLSVMNMWIFFPLSLTRPKAECTISFDCCFQMIY